MLLIIPPPLKIAQENVDGGTTAKQLTRLRVAF